MQAAIIRNIFKNTLSLLFGGIISQLLAFIATIYLARILGPTDFGKINFALAIVLYFSLFSNWGLSIYGTRGVAREQYMARYYVGDILFLRTVFSVLSFSALLLLAFFLNKPIDIKFLVIIYGLGIFPSSLFLDWLFQGVQKMKNIAFARILNSLVYLCLILFFIKSSSQLLFIPWFYVIGSLFASLILFLIFIYKFGMPKWKFDPSSWKRIIRKAFPMGLSLIMIQIYYNMDIVMLGFMKGESEVGFYSAAYKIILFILMIGGAYHDSVFPVISSFFKESLEDFKKLQEKTLKLMALIALPLIVGGMILAVPILTFVYDASYFVSVGIFQILIWVVFFIFFNTTYSRGLLTCNKENGYLLGVAFAAFMNLLLNFILIPFWGAKGAAIATVFSEFFALIVFYVEFNKVCKLKFINYLFIPVISCLIMGIFLWFGLNIFNLNLFILIFLGTIVYFLAVFLLKGITLDEVRSFRDMMILKK